MCRSHSAPIHSRSGATSGPKSSARTGWWWKAGATRTPSAVRPSSCSVATPPSARAPLPLTRTRHSPWMTKPRVIYLLPRRRVAPQHVQAHVVLEQLDRQRGVRLRPPEAARLRPLQLLELVGGVE